MYLHDRADFILKKLEKDQPTLYFTPDGSRHLFYTPYKKEYYYDEKGNIIDDQQCLYHGYYEIKDSSIGPVMFRLGYTSFLHASNIYNAITMKVGEVSEEFLKGRYRDMYSDFEEFIGNMRRVQTNKTPQIAEKQWQKFVGISQTKLNAIYDAERDKSHDLTITFDAFKALCRSHANRPYEPSDFAPSDHFIPDIPSHIR